MALKSRPALLQHMKDILRLSKEFPELYEGCFIQKPIQIGDLVNKINEELKPKA